MNYKLYRDYGIRLEELILSFSYIKDSKYQDDRDIILENIQQNIEYICQNQGHVFSNIELAKLREINDELQSVEVETIRNRLANKALRQIEKLNCKIPFFLHGVMFGKLKLTVAECLGVWIFAILWVLLFYFL